MVSYGQNQELPIRGLTVLGFRSAQLGRSLTMAGNEVVVLSITLRPIITRNSFQIPPEYQGALYAHRSLIPGVPVCVWPPCTADRREAVPAFGSAPFRGVCLLGQTTPFFCYSTYANTVPHHSDTIGGYLCVDQPSKYSVMLSRNEGDRETPISSSSSC